MRFSSFAAAALVTLCLMTSVRDVTAAQPAKDRYFVQVIVTFTAESGSGKGREYNLGWTKSSDGYHVPLVIYLPFLPKELQSVAMTLPSNSDFVTSRRDESLIRWYSATEQTGKDFALYFLQQKGTDRFNSKHTKNLITNGAEPGYRLNRIGVILFRNKDSIPER